MEQSEGASIENAKGRLALVTGAHKGIGLAICQVLASLPHTTVLLTSRHEAPGRAALASLQQLQPSFSLDFHVLDVANPDSVLQLQRYVEATYGRLDILVNNAGTIPLPTAF